MYIEGPPPLNIAYVSSEQTKLDLFSSVYTSISWKQKPINQKSYEQ